MQYIAPPPCSISHHYHAVYRTTTMQYIASPPMQYIAPLPSVYRTTTMQYIAPLPCDNRTTTMQFIAPLPCDNRTTAIQSQVRTHVRTSQMLARLYLFRCKSINFGQNLLNMPMPLTFTLFSIVVMRGTITPRRHSNVYVGFDVFISNVYPNLPRRRAYLRLPVVISVLTFSPADATAAETGAQMITRHLNSTAVILVPCRQQNSSHTGPLQTTAQQSYQSLQTTEQQSYQSLADNRTGLQTVR